MKHYITIGAALLLSVVLIFNPAAKAVSISVSVYAAATAINATLTNQYTVDYEMDSTDTNYPYGNYNVYTYEAYIPVVASGISVDSYINGASSGTITISPSAPTGATLASRSISFEPYSGNGFWSTAYNLSTTNITCRVMFDNYYSNNSGVLQLGVIHYFVSYTMTATPSNVPDPPPNVSVSISSSTSSAVGATPEPLDMGFCDIISTAIMNAINDNSLPFDDILQVLEDIRTNDQTAYTQIVTYLSDNDTFNSTLYTWLTTVLEDNFTDLLDDTTYISSVLNAARNLINSMNSRDSLYYPIFEAALDLANTRLQTLINLMSETPAEAASMENAINQMESKQAAINDYSLPAAGNIMGNANSYVSQGTAGMNLLATILNQPLYILILMTVISLAFVSYLLYGKGV